MADTLDNYPGVPNASVDASVTPARIMWGFRGIGLLLALSMLCMAAPSLLNDPDTLWHIRLGQDISATGFFPISDAYSHSFAGEPWIAKQWLSGVLFFWAQSLAGWNGVVGLSIIALCSTFALVHGQLSRHLAPLPALMISLWAFAMSSSAFVARPHVLALPVAVWFIIHVWNAADDKRTPHPLALIAIILWANLHGSFTLGFIAVVFAFLHFASLDPVLGQPRRWTFRELWQQQLLRRWMVFGLLCPVAACVHPYGWQAIASTFVMADNTAIAHITEWQPFDFSNNIIASLSLVTIFVAGLATPLRAPLFKAAFLALLLYMFLSHARFAPFFYSLAVSLIALDIARTVPVVSRANWEARKDWDVLQLALARRPILAFLILAVTGATLLTAAVGISKLHPEKAIYPLAAIDAARSAGLEGPVMNSYNFGGALIHEGIPTFVDGRADRLFNNGAFIAEYIAAAGNPLAIEQLLDTYQITWTLLEPNDPNVAVMDALDGWQRTYVDAEAIIHTQPSANR